MAAIVRMGHPSHALRAWEPAIRPYDIWDEVDMLLRDWEPFTYRTSSTLPMDMFEEKDELVVRAEFPGIKKEDIDISLEGDQLVIKAEKKEEEVSEDAYYYTCGRSFGRYFRSVSLPFSVNASKISTTFENGLLEVRLPKAEESKAKRIEIKGGGTRKSLTTSK